MIENKTEEILDTGEYPEITSNAYSIRSTSTTENSGGNTSEPIYPIVSLDSPGSDYTIPLTNECIIPIRASGTNCNRIIVYVNSLPICTFYGNSMSYDYPVNSAGSYTIYVRAMSDTGTYAKSNSYTVTVINNILATSIDISPSTITMTIGDTATLSATVYPSNTTDKTVLWSSSNTNVICVDYYTGEITALAEGTASVTAYSAVGNTISSNGCSITVLSQERTVRANCVIQENTAYIRSAANMFGLQPVDVAMVIYAEQCINVDWKDEVIDPMLAPTLNVSLGLGQMRISTARKVEDNGYLPITHYSEWHGNNSVENRDAGIAIKLLNAQENAKYVAGYLAYIIDLCCNVCYNKGAAILAQ